MIVSRSGWSYGNGRNRTVFTTLKIAVVAPIPSASVRIAVSANAGFLRSVRPANARSLANVCMAIPSRNHSSGASAIAPICGCDSRFRHRTVISL